MATLKIKLEEIESKYSDFFIKSDSHILDYVKLKFDPGSFEWTGKNTSSIRVGPVIDDNLPQQIKNEVLELFKKGEK